MKKITFMAIAAILVLSSFSDPYWYAFYSVKNNTPFYLQVKIDWKRESPCKKCSLFNLAPRTSLQFFNDQGIIVPMPQEIIETVLINVNRNDKLELFCIIDEKSGTKWNTVVEGFDIHYSLVIAESSEKSKTKGKNHPFTRSTEALNF